MSERPRWLRGDLIAVAVVVIAPVVGLLSRDWRMPVGGSRDPDKFSAIEKKLDAGPSGRVSNWHCGMANPGAYPGGPMITHSEGQ